MFPHFGLIVVILILMSVNSLKRVVVIGGGAAGYFSAIECATVLSSRKDKYEVFLLAIVTYLLVIFFNSHR